MALVSLGDMAQNFLLRSQNAQLKTDLQRHSQELSTGRTTDVGRRVAGDFSPLAGIERSLTRIGAFQTLTSEAGLLAGAMQAALSSIGDQASELTPSLLTAKQGSLPAHIDSIGAEAHSRFSTALLQLNAQLGDRSLFAGVATDGPAVADSETIMTALAGAVSSAVTADEVAQAVSDWFDDPAGFATVGYLGSSQALSPLTVGEGAQVSISASAADPEVRDMLKGLAIAALLDEGVLAGQPDQRANLATKAGEQLLSAQPGWTGLQSRLGVAEELIAEAESRNAAESSALQIARSNLISVDPYETATALQATQIQLETLYSITARLSRLSLTEYL